MGVQADGRFDIEEREDHLHIRAMGHFDAESTTRATELAAEKIRQPGKRWNIVTDFTDAFIEERAANKILAAYSKGNRPFVRKSAVLGLGGTKRFFFDIVVRISGRHDLRPFRNYEDALEWFDKPLPDEEE